jgi:hypothetical protein
MDEGFLIAPSYYLEQRRNSIQLQSSVIPREQLKIKLLPDNLSDLGVTRRHQCLRFAAQETETSEATGEQLLQ